MGRQVNETITLADVMEELVMEPMLLLPFDVADRIFTESGGEIYPRTSTPSPMAGFHYVSRDPNFGIVRANVNDVITLLRCRSSNALFNCRRSHYAAILVDESKGALTLFGNKNCGGTRVMLTQPSIPNRSAEEVKLDPRPGDQRDCVNGVDLCLYRRMGLVYYERGLEIMSCSPMEWACDGTEFIPWSSP